MRFDSLVFGLFFALTFLLYWVLQHRGHRAQNALLVLAGCVFYGWLDYRFLLLLLGLAICDYLVGRRLMTAGRPGFRRFLLGISIAAGLGSLAAFKYANFFLESVAALLRTVGFNAQVGTLNILLPLGISFFTLQRLTYTLDIYRRRLDATRDLLSFAAFCTFFPLLLSGPIERAARLLPQFEQDRVFDLQKSKDALRQILWGLFKKIVIADNLAGRVTFVFAHFDRIPSIDLAGGALLFAVQLYADFSGYSDIAIGVSRLLGIRVIRNFAYPYFSRDMAEFWRRWHISMSTWFRDYLYTPLSMNLSLNARARRMGCVLLTFAATGLWHGAAWTFVVWGVLNGIGLAPLVFWDPTLRETKQAAQGRRLPTWREGFQIGATFGYVVLTWVFFRAESLTQALGFLAHMFTHSWLTIPGSKWLLLLAAAFLLFEWMRRETEHPLDVRGLPVAVRWSVYAGLSFSIALFGNLGKVDFIYMRF